MDLGINTLPPGNGSNAERRERGGVYAFVIKLHNFRAPPGLYGGAAASMGNSVRMKQPRVQFH